MCDGGDTQLFNYLYLPIASTISSTSASTTSARDMSHLVKLSLPNILFRMLTAVYVFSIGGELSVQLWHEGLIRGSSY